MEIEETDSDNDYFTMMDYLPAIKTTKSDEMFIMENNQQVILPDLESMKQTDITLDDKIDTRFKAIINDYLDLSSISAFDIGIIPKIKFRVLLKDNVQLPRKIVEYKLCTEYEHEIVHLFQIQL